MKQIRCKNCKKKGVPRNNSTIGYYCEKQECQDMRIKKALEKGREQIKKEEKEWKKKAIEKLKTLYDWKNDLQVNINLIARLIDKGQPCIATGKYEGKMSGGHFIAVGANQTIRFNLLNIHIQSFHSNSWKGGDNHRYREGIKAVYGQAVLDEMEALQSIPVIKLTVDEIREKISIAKQIIKELKAADEIYTPEERIELRKKINKRLGIYK